MLPLRGDGGQGRSLIPTYVASAKAYRLFSCPGGEGSCGFYLLLAVPGASCLRGEGSCPPGSQRSALLPAHPGPRSWVREPTCQAIVCVRCHGPMTDTGVNAGACERPGGLYPALDEADHAPDDRESLEERECLPVVVVEDDPALLVEPHV